MVRKLLLFQLLWLVLAAIPARAATLTVCDGTATEEHLPLFGYYADNFAKSEVIIPADLLQDMVDCPITAMRWYIQSQANTEWGATFRVFVKEVEQRTFVSQGPFSGPGTIVYEGPLSGSGTEMGVTFDAPYVYQGGNLLIGVYTVDTGTYSHCHFYGISTSSWDDPATGFYAYNAA